MELIAESFYRIDSTMDRTCLARRFPLEPVDHLRCLVHGRLGADGAYDFSHWPSISLVESVDRLAFVAL